MHGSPQSVQQFLKGAEIDLGGTKTVCDHVQTAPGVVYFTSEHHNMEPVTRCRTRRSPYFTYSESGSPSQKLITIFFM